MDKKLFFIQSISVLLLLLLLLCFSRAHYPHYERGFQDTIPFPCPLFPGTFPSVTTTGVESSSTTVSQYLPVQVSLWVEVGGIRRILGIRTLSQTIKPTWQLQEVGSPPLPSPFRCLEGQWPQILIGEDAGIRGITLHRLPRATVTPRSQVGKTALGTASASLVWRLRCLLLLWLHRKSFTVRLRQVTGGLAITPPTCHHAVRTGAIQRMV